MATPSAVARRMLARRCRTHDDVLAHATLYAAIVERPVTKGLVRHWRALLRKREIRASA